MKSFRIGTFTIASLACFASAQAQIPAALRAGANLPAGQVAAPNTPGGGVVVGSNLYTGDAAQGFRHWKPADAANPDPVNTGILTFDTTLSLGGGGLCLPFCQVGQVAYDGNQTAYLAAYDHQKGNGATAPGVWRVSIDPAGGQPFLSALLAPNAGLAGNNPSSLALGPDGSLYVGFLKNDSVVRILHPTLNAPDPSQIVQPVGKAPNGSQIRSMAFVGTDLYLADSQGLSVIRNAVASTCTGGCNAVRLGDGFTGVPHVGITTDGINRLYFAVNGQVWRYTVSSGAMRLVSTGGPDPVTGALLNFAFVNGHTNLVQLDRLGNLWIGDDTSDGLRNFSGRIWYISAGALSSLP